MRRDACLGDEQPQAADAAERERVRGEIEARTVAPIVEQHDRIARPELDAIDGADLFAEFAGVGQPIQPSAEEIAAAEEAAKRDREIVEEQQRRRLAELEEHNRELKLCTCATPQAGVYARHEDECPALSEDERQRRAEAKQKVLDAKVERLRANGGLLVAGGAA